MKPKLRHRFNLRVPMRDGVTLSANVTEPAEGGPFPVLLTRTPYGKSGEPAAKGGVTFAGKGYACVQMDVRGRGDSEGEFEPYRNDGPDGHDAIEWLAAQPWCTGAVGTYGGSYPGQIQWLAALERPVHLKAMVVAVSPSDPFVEWPTGAPSPMHVCWHRMTDGRALQYVEQVEWMDVYRHLPLETMDEAAGFRSKNWRRDLAHPTLDGYWEPLRYQHRFAEIDVPVLHVSGWYDDEQIGTPLNFAGMRAGAASEAARTAQRLLMGPWGHHINSARQVGEVDFGPDALIDLEGTMARFFDHHLKGEANGVEAEAPARIFLMGANVWRDEPEWPPPGVEFTDYFLRGDGSANSRFGDGRLTGEAPEGDEPPDAYRHDPMRPVPFLTDPLSNQIGGPDDYSAVEQRGDVLCYTTEPLAEDLTVIGPVRLELFAASSAPDTDFCAKLVDVHPGGFCQRLCDGVVRARYREGMDHEVPLEPGSVERFEIDLWNTSQVFGTGHRIRLEVASSAFPKYPRNLGTGGPLGAETDPVVAENHVWHTAVRPSKLVLPVVPRG